MKRICKGSVTAVQGLLIQEDKDLQGYSSAEAAMESNLCGYKSWLMKILSKLW